MSGIILRRDKKENLGNIREGEIVYATDTGELGIREISSPVTTWSSLGTINSHSAIIESLDDIITDQGEYINNIGNQVSTVQQESINAILTEKSERIQALAEQATTLAEVDGKVTTEEQARIAGLGAVSDAYKEYVRLVSLAMSDGVLTNEERTTIDHAYDSVKAVRDRISDVVSSQTTFASDLSALDTSISDLTTVVANTDGKISTEEQARIDAINAEQQARIADISAKTTELSLLDGKISTEEQARIDGLAELSAAYKEYSRVVSLAMSDGVLTSEEQALIADAATEVNAVKERLNSVVSGQTTLTTDLSNLTSTVSTLDATVSDVALDVASVDGKISTEEQARIDAINAEQQARIADISAKTTELSLLDGKISTEEQARIDGLAELSDAYKEYSRVVSLAMSDGVLTPEEQALIADASAEVDAVKERINGNFITGDSGISGVPIVQRSMTKSVAIGPSNTFSKVWEFEMPTAVDPSPYTNYSQNHEMNITVNAISGNSDNVDTYSSFEKLSAFDQVKSDTEGSFLSIQSQDKTINNLSDSGLEYQVRIVSYPRKFSFWVKGGVDVNSTWGTTQPFSLSGIGFSSVAQVGQKVFIVKKYSDFWIYDIVLDTYVHKTTLQSEMGVLLLVKVWNGQARIFSIKADEICWFDYNEESDQFSPLQHSGVFLTNSSYYRGFNLQMTSDTEFFGVCSGEQNSGDSLFKMTIFSDLGADENIYDLGGNNESNPMAIYTLGNGDIFTFGQGTIDGSGDYVAWKQEIVDDVGTNSGKNFGPRVLVNNSTDVYFNDFNSIVFEDWVYVYGNIKDLNGYYTTNFQRFNLTTGTTEFLEPDQSIPNRPYDGYDNYSVGSSFLVFFKGNIYVYGGDYFDGSLINVDDVRIFNGVSSQLNSCLWDFKVEDKILPQIVS